MGATWDQPDFRTWEPFVANDALLIGSHNIFERNGLILNDRSKLDCFWVDELTGFDSADITVSATANVEEDGELPDAGSRPGRTMTLTGWIQAGNYMTLIKMGRALLDSLLDLEELPLVISTHPDSPFQAPEVMIRCRLADKPTISMKIDQSAQTFLRQSFTIALRASRPEFLGTELKIQTIKPTTLGVLGRVYDRTYDLGYTTTIDAASNPVPSTSNSATIINRGNWRARPVITLDGPMTMVRLTNSQTGQQALFPSIAAGRQAVVDGMSSSVLDENGELAESLMDPSSDFIWLEGIRGLRDGTNTIELGLSAYEDGANITIEWQDTWL